MSTMTDIDSVPGHNAYSEPAPRSSIYHPAYKIVTASIEEMVQLLREPLEESTYTDPNVEGLKSLLKRRSKARFPDEVRIALVGDMASGKSSLVNSLLSTGILARKGNTGTSCTWVIQEFRKTLPNQTKSFRAEVEYYSETELGGVIAFLLKEAYISLPSPKDDDSEIQELDETNAQSSISGLTAIRTILALFCDKPECSSEEAVVNFVREASSENDKNLTRKMLFWAWALLKRYVTAEDGLVSVIESATPEDLLQQLRRYTFDNNDDEDDEREASPWPLIKKITFGLDSPLLNDGVILVDLPGVHDTNGTRRRTVLKALAECTHYLIVAQISRARDDETVTKYFNEGHTRKGSGRVIAAITNTDRIDNSMSARTTNAVESRDIDDIREKVLSISGELDNLKAKRKTATKAERLEIYEKEEQLQLELCEAEAAEESYKIMIRNKRVIKELKRSYQYLTGDQRPLALFCVSNRIYERYQMGYEKSELPVLSLEDTQVPALRQHLRLATAQGRFNDALFHYDKQLPSLLTSFELWCCKTHMKRRAELEEMIVEPKERCQAVIELLFDQIKTYIETQILVLMKQKQKAWDSQATALCKTWQTQYNIGAYVTMLRKEGFRKGTKTKAEISWNRELVNIMAADLRPRCDKLIDTLFEQERMVAINLEEPMSLAKEKISNDPQSALMALSPLLKKIELEKPAMRKCVDMCFKHLRRSLKKMKLDLITDTEDSILSECMQPVYAGAASIKGGGSGTKRPAAVLQGITGEGALWSVVHNTARERFDEVLAKRQNKLESDVMGILNDIHNDFKSCCQDKEVEDEGEKALREKLTQNMDKAKKIYEGALSQSMAECKAYQA